jgi:hypothetical protein
MELTLSMTVGGTTTDITQAVPSITWSGDIAQCGRVLSFGALASATDSNIPVIDAPLGAGAVLAAGGKDLFEGYIFNRQKLTDSSVMEIVCYDRGIYVKKNSIVRNFTNMTPEAITRRVCADFDIKVGEIAATGVSISRNFPGVSLYKVIQTVYTLASRSTDNSYHIRFEGGTLNVRVKDLTDETLIIQGGSNLMSAAVTESIERMVNRVEIYSAEDELLQTVRNDELIKLYGVMQEVIRQGKDEDAGTRAQKMLKDNGISQKITIHNLGNHECITGNAIVVQEPYTGLHGLFWIDSDTHTWKNGLYLNKLILNFRRMMDEHETGSLPVAKPSGSGKADPVKDKWVYIHKANNTPVRGAEIVKMTR